MPVFLSQHAGFCDGVKNALALTLREASRGKQVTMLGPLVHNEEVTRLLYEKKVNVMHDPEKIGEGTVIIRTHGATPQIFECLHQKDNVEVIDATCSYVKRLQKIAHDFSKRDYDVVIYGDRHHPEVQALLGWAGKRAMVIEPGDTGMLEGLHLSDKAVLISQTTQRESEFLEVAGKLQELYPNIEVYKTICKATVLRQNAAAAMASTVDLMLVVGDNKSSNTRKLFQVCREITKTYQIAGAGDISDSCLVGVEKVGVTAGASTPDWTIKEVMVKMEECNFESRAEESFSLQDEVKEYRPGDVVTGKVVMVEDDQVMVDIGYKSEAVLPRGEVFLEGEETLKEKFSPGDGVDLLVLKMNEQEDKLIVSQKRLDRERRWKELEDALESGIDMNGRVKEIVPAGIIINLGSGIEGFMPGSLVDVKYIPDFEQFLGQEFEFKVIELNRERDKVILSRKQTIEEENEKKKGETLHHLQEGEIINGVVKRLTDFGAFVDVGGIDGLVHISEVSWQRIDHPQDMLKVGEEINVKVLEVIPERERISLSIRQAKPDPWSTVGEKFNVGDIVSGRVTRIVNFGAFVELIPGVEGLVHISQMADFHVKHPSEIIQEGEEIEAKILDINSEGKRISLSIKEARPAPRDFSVHSQQKEGNNQGVTLGDVFGDLFQNNNSGDDEEQ